MEEEEKSEKAETGDVLRLCRLQPQLGTGRLAIKERRSGKSRFLANELICSMVSSQEEVDEWGGVMRVKELK